LTSTAEWDNKSQGQADVGSGWCSVPKTPGKVEPPGEESMEFEKDQFEEDDELSRLEDDELGGDGEGITEEEEEILVVEEEPNEEGEEEPAEKATPKAAPKKAAPKKVAKKAPKKAAKKAAKVKKPAKKAAPKKKAARKKRR
jgi:hypothetical protein